MEDPRAAARAGRVRRHARWVVPLVAAPAVFLACVLALDALNRHELYHGAWAFLVLLVVAVAFLGPVALLAVAIAKGARTFREHRRSRGRFSATERAEIGRRDAAAHAWANAQGLHRQLLAREVPPTLRVWDVVPYAGEEFFCDVPAGYARYYGTTVSYTQTSGFYYGRPSFVLTGLAVTAIANAAERSAAQAQAREQWRERCVSRLVVSNHRLLVQVHGRWLSFDYSAMTAVLPEPDGWALVCQFSSTEPLLLTGDHAPFAAVMTLYRTHGEQALRDHPGLEPLRPVHGPASPGSEVASDQRVR